MNVWRALNKVGNVKFEGGDRAGTLAAYKEGLDIARRLAAQDAGSAQAQTKLVAALFNISAVGNSSEARAALTEALSIVERLEKEGKLAAAQKKWPDLTRAALAMLP